MEVIFSANAIEDLNYWKHTGNEKVLIRIRSLIQDIKNEPFRGIGKPEPLKYNLSGMWSRRINREHRIIYEVESGFITIHALKEHY